MAGSVVVVGAHRRISPESNCVFREELSSPSDAPISAAHQEAKNRAPTGRTQTDTQLVKTEKLKSKELRN